MSTEREAVSAAPTGAPGRLLELTVTDLALIDRLRLGFEPGLNVITGETGAGKSLLIDALGLALGARADTALAVVDLDEAVEDTVADGCRVVVDLLK